MTIEDMVAAYTEYKDAKQDHEGHRLKFIETFPPKHRDRILCQEESRRQGRVSRMISGKLKGGSVTRVLRSEMVNGQEVLTECSTRKDINDLLMEVNPVKYKQCGNSPFLQEPLLTAFGYTGDTAATEQVLAGTYVPPPGTARYTQLLLQHMKRPSTITPAPMTPDFVSTEDHQQSWRRAKEYTTSGVSGVHFGMFKAQAMDPELAAFDASRRSIVYRTGQVYDRWTVGADAMLLKGSGDKRAHKLRTIFLMEADFNMNNKKMSREGMWNAEKAE